MSEELKLPFWWTEHSKICQKIAETPGFLKIILKTKDDSFFLERWVKHHLKIVGSENLIIFDNMSTNTAVLKYYETLPAELVVARYDRFHNFIHSIEIFHQLYETLWDSCKYFCILDTDEMLTLVEDDFRINTEATVDFLKKNDNFDVLPGTWLSNCFKSERLFGCGSQRTLEDGLRWGKPILRASPKIRGIINHNCEVPKEMYRSETPVNFFVLHMNSLYPEQRVQANLRKLVARNFARSDDSVESILSKDRAGIDDRNITLYLDEIERIIAKKSVAEAKLTKGVIDFGEPGQLHFGSDDTKIMLSKYMKSGAGNCVDRIFINGSK